RCSANPDRSLPLEPPPLCLSLTGTRVSNKNAPQLIHHLCLQLHAITRLRPRLRIHAPFARANDGGHESRIKKESNKTRMGDDGEGRKTRARPRRNRGARGEFQGSPAEV